MCGGRVGSVGSATSSRTRQRELHHGPFIRCGSGTILFRQVPDLVLFFKHMFLNLQKMHYIFAKNQVPVPILIY